MTEMIRFLATTLKLLAIRVWHQHNGFHPFPVFVIIPILMRCCLVNQRTEWAKRVKKGSVAQTNIGDVAQCHTRWCLGSSPLFRAGLWISYQAESSLWQPNPVFVGTLLSQVGMASCATTTQLGMGLICIKITKQLQVLLKSILK